MKKQIMLNLLFILIIIVCIVFLIKYEKSIEILDQHIIKLKKNVSGKELQIKDLRADFEEQTRLYLEVVDLYAISEELYRKQIELLEIENEELRTIRAKLTQYSPLDNQDGNQAMGDNTKTSRGYTVGREIAASDPKKIPYGTILEIPSYGVVEIQDTGSALRRNNKEICVDLYADTYKSAMTFGIQRKDIKIIKWGE